MNKLEREYRDRVFAFFEPYTAEATQALRSILSRSYPDKVVFLDFVMFGYDRFRDTMPIFTWPTTRENTVCNDFDCPLAAIKIEDFDFYDEELEDLVEIGWHLKDCAARWLQQVWRNSGGELFSLPCYFTDHDDLDSFSFRKTDWVDNDPETK